MGTMTARLTVEQYLALPEEQIARTELIDGEIVQMSEARLIHEVVKSNAAGILLAWRSSHPEFRVLIEAGYRLDRETALQPDASVIETARIDDQSLTEVPAEAPLIAVEVVSSDPADRLEYKISKYLSLGTREVWVVYPKRKVVYVHRHAGVFRLGIEGTLRSEALPEFTAAVRTFFEDVP